MRLSIIGAPLRAHIPATDVDPTVHIFGASSFICYGGHHSTYDLVLVDGQYYVDGLFGVDFDQPATPVYAPMPNGKMALVAFEI